MIKHYVIYDILIWNNNILNSNMNANVPHPNVTKIYDFFFNVEGIFDFFLFVFVN